LQKMPLEILCTSLWILDLQILRWTVVHTWCKPPIFLPIYWWKKMCLLLILDIIGRNRVISSICVVYFYLSNRFYPVIPC
jgi:hypothetical protein